MLFASMKAAQFANWTDVLVVIGGSDTETRVASSKVELRTACSMLDVDLCV